MNGRDRRLRDALVREAKIAPDSLLAASGRFAVALVSGAAPGALFDAAHAQIVTDGTADGSLVQNTLTPDGSGNFSITEAMGNLAGNNLFHSFNTFSIGTGQSATFSATTSGIANVVSRVTGGAVSQIDGALISNIPGADFYFINPAGVTFGAGASVNVPAAFHVSTASELRFANGDILLSAGGMGSTFSTAAPQSFGFTGAPVGNITLNGASINTSAAHSSLDLTAANITQSGGGIVTDGAVVRMIAAGTATVTASVSPTGAVAGTATGSLSLANADNAAGSTTAGSGGWRVRAGAMNMNQATLRAPTSGSVAGAGHDIRVASLAMSNFSSIASQTNGGNASAGGISVVASGDVAITNSNIVANATAGSGDASDVSITAHNLSISGTTPGVFGVASNAVNTATGSAGDIDVNLSGELLVTGDFVQGSPATTRIVGLISTSGGAASGAGGDVSIDATNITLVGGVISSGKGSATAASGGNIDINASGRIQIDGIGKGIGIGASAYTAGSAGDINVVADEVRLSNVAKIQSDGFEGASGGGVNVNARLITLIGGSTSIDNFTGIQSKGGGPNAHITIVGDEIRLSGETSISSDLELAADPGGFDRDSGDAGDVSVTATSFIRIMSGAGVGAGASAGTVHNAGDVRLQAPEITVVDGYVSSHASTGALGSAGDVTLVGGASGAFFLRSAVLSTTDGVGHAGDISVSGRQVSSVDSFISSGSGSHATGDAGDVTISGDNIFIRGHGLPQVFLDAEDISADNGFGGVSSTTTAAGAGGDVRLIAVNRIDLDDTQIISLREEGSDGGGPPGTGAGGSVYLTAPQIDVGRTFIATATSGVGASGNVVITAPTSLNVHDQSVFSAQTLGQGRAGNVQVTAGAVTVSGAADAKNWLVQAFEALPETDYELAPAGSGFASSAVGPATGASGSVSITAASLEMTGGAFIASTAGESAASAGGANINAGSVTLNGASVSSDTFGGGDAGDVSIAANTLTLRNGAEIGSDTHASGDGGEILINARTTALYDSSINSDAFALDFDDPPPSGSAGSIRIVGESLSLFGGDADIGATTEGSGQAGSITIELVNDLILDGDVAFDGGEVASISSTSIGGRANDGAAGSISIRARDVALNDAYLRAYASGGGRAGSVTLNVRDLSLENRSEINAQSKNGSGSGSVSITARDVTLDRSAIISSTLGSADAGDVTLSVNSLELNNGSGVLSSAQRDFDSGAVGAAGDIRIDANSLVVRGAEAASGGRKHSNIGAFAGPGAGQAGNVTVKAPSVRLVDGGQITAFANNAAGGGGVTIDADTVEVTGSASAGLAGLRALYGEDGREIEAPGVGLNSGFITDTFSAGKAGTIIVRAKSISFLNGGLARSNTSSSGAGGTIIICADGTILIDGVGSAAIANSSAGSTGNAGVIGLQADKLQLARGGRVTVATAGTGQGGQIVIQAHDVDLSNEGGSANPGEATGITTLVSGAAGAASVQGAGQVTVFAGEMSVAGGSVVTTDSTGAAPAGRIVIRAGTLDIRGATTTVSSAAVGAAKGNAGVIDIGAYNVELNGAKISTFSESGSGGQVSFSVDNQILLVKGEITTKVRGATNDSNAGNIYVGVRAAAPQFTNPCDGVCAPGFDPFLGVTRPNFETGTGVPKAFVNEGTPITASADQGRGGAITIHADTRIDNGPIIADPDSFYDVSSNAGLDGTVTAQGATFAMPAFIPPPDDEQRSMCEAQRAGFENQLEQALGRRSEDPTAPRFMAYDEPAEQRLALAGGGAASCETAKEDELWTPSLFGRRLP